MPGSPCFLLQGVLYYQHRAGARGEAQPVGLVKLHLEWEVNNGDPKRLLRSARNINQLPSDILYTLHIMKLANLVRKMNKI